MKIHEYQGKEILRKFGVTVPRGIPCMSVDEAVKAAETLGGPVWVVKAQIHAGGRGKGGGVKVAKSLDQVREYANAIMGMQLVTHQTSPAGQKVRRLLVEAAWHHQHRYVAGKIMRDRWDLAGAAARAHGDLGNRRMNKRWNQFKARKKTNTVANTAIARELAGWCWSLATLQE